MKRPSLNSVYNCDNPKRIIRLITRLRLGLSHLREQRFKHGFHVRTNAICSCGNDVESTEHFFLYDFQFDNERSTALSNLGHFDITGGSMTAATSKMELFVTIVNN